MGQFGIGLGSEFLLCVGQFVVGLGNKYLLCVGQFVVCLGERVIAVCETVLCGFVEWNMCFVWISFLWVWDI